MATRTFFFAIETRDGLEIDAVGRDLADSSVYERIDVENGLSAWDDAGRRYMFEEPRDPHGGWTATLVAEDDAEQLLRALRKFLHLVVTSRRRRGIAKSLGLTGTVIDNAGLDELQDMVRSLDLERRY
jgi:hypothetical protein